MEEYKSDELTLEKMRRLIMQTKICREDKNCGGCRMVNFCAIWNNRWPDIKIAKSNGIICQAYYEYRVRDLPILGIGRIAAAVDKAFSLLFDYMQDNDLFFNAEYTGFKHGDDREEEHTNGK